MKILHIKKSAEFQKIGKNSDKFYSHTVLLLSKETPKIYLENSKEGKNAKDFCRVGFTVAKTVSKLAVVRNLAKRRLREAFKNLAPKYAKKHRDYVVIARSQIVQADFAKIFQDLKFCLSKIDNFQPKKDQKFPQKNVSGNSKKE